MNYDAETKVTGIWVLGDAEDRFFSQRRTNSNARTIDMPAAGDHVEVVLERSTRAMRRRD